MPARNKLVKKHRMPCCGYKVEAATAVGGPDDAKPRPGDVTICLNCGTWCIFKNNLTTRLFDPEDLVNFGDEQLSLMRRATKLIRSHNRRYAPPKGET